MNIILFWAQKLRILLLIYRLLYIMLALIFSWVFSEAKAALFDHFNGIFFFRIMFFFLSENKKIKHF